MTTTITAGSFVTVYIDIADHAPKNLFTRVATHPENFPMMDEPEYADRTAVLAYWTSRVLDHGGIGDVVQIGGWSDLEPGTVTFRVEAGEDVRVYP